MSPTSDRPSIFEVRVLRRRPGVALDTASGDGALPLDREEWLAAVADDDDLEPGDEPETWRLRSHPEGPPIRWEDGRLVIHHDDETTIAKLVEIARALDAEVVAEDGTVFFDSGFADVEESAPAAGPAPAGLRRRVLLDDERVRRRQAWIALAAGLVLPVIVLGMLLLGRHPGKLLLGGLAGLTVAGLAVHALARPKFTLEDRGGGSLVAHLPETRSTSSDVAEKRIPRSELDPLELVWFPLEYPAKTVTEYHVRARAHPWLVLFATNGKESARGALQEMARTLGVNAEDRSEGEPTADVPARYRLSEAERRKKPKAKR